MQVDPSRIGSYVRVYTRRRTAVPIEHPQVGAGDVSRSRKPLGDWVFGGGGFIHT